MCMATTEKQLGARVLRALMVMSVLAGVVQAVVFALMHAEAIESAWQALLYAVVVVSVAASMIALVINDRRGRVGAARMFARALAALLLVAFALDALLIEGTPLSSVFVVQFLLVVAYQMAHDPNLDRHHPREGGFSGAIPLSFFNMFWIFVICSVLGLIGETLVSLVRDGHWESRAGFVFGPFSPIYGVGAVLITAALNRMHRKPTIALFVIAAFVGGAFEFFAGWFFETAFGIVAWSYEGQPLNIHGHTSLPIACVWGLIGVGWMKIALPWVMQFIDRIPLRARVPLTLAGTVFLLADAILTVVCLDCWYLRKLGLPPETPWQELCATYFGDEFMQSRFETMSMWPVLAQR